MLTVGIYKNVILCTIACSGPGCIDKKNFRLYTLPLTVPFIREGHPFFLSLLLRRTRASIQVKRALPVWFVALRA